QDLLLHPEQGGRVDRDIPRFRPETPVVTALETLRRSRCPLGVVEVGGKPSGIVTLKDLVEPLLGDLRAW
ncbi:MAG: CBS domain-containing protein, partial [Planctomycetota bacterium]|nr:CBS domain-containing protein [Planctomycetota bacterium]